MDKQLIEEVIACLPEGRTKFYYFRDRYALMLLSYLVGQGKSVAELKNSRLRGLLERPQVKSLLADLGHGLLRAETLTAHWAQDVHAFVLTVDRWGGERPQWQQTTRHGYNLVLQMNFSNAHDRQYRSLVKPGSDALLNYGGHPVLQSWRPRLFRETLAWARLDLDFDSNEVLIEEIQSDWVRSAEHLLYWAQRSVADNRDYLSRWQVNGKAQRVIHYVKQVLAPYRKIWDEAMLAATIGFVREELGINRVFYHSHQSGPRLKYIDGETPRDLYSRLPRRFCFEATTECPMFLQQDRQFRRRLKKIVTPLWYQLNLEEGHQHAHIS